MFLFLTYMCSKTDSFHTKAHTHTYTHVHIQYVSFLKVLANAKNDLSPNFMKALLILKLLCCRCEFWTLKYFMSRKFKSCESFLSDFIEENAFVILNLLESFWGDERFFFIQKLPKSQRDLVKNSFLNGKASSIPWNSRLWNVFVWITFRELYFIFVSRLCFRLHLKSDKCH